MTQIEVFAKYVVSRRYKNGNPITNLDLQQILKQIQDAQKEPKLFYDEYQQLGGIKCYPNIYYLFSGYGVMPITYVYNVNISQREAEIVNNIIDNYVDNVTRILKGVSK